MYGAYNQRYQAKSQFDTEAGAYEVSRSRTPRWQGLLRRLCFFVLCSICFVIAGSFLEPQSVSYQWMIREELAASNTLAELEASLVKAVKDSKARIQYNLGGLSSNNNALSSDISSYVDESDELAFPSSQQACTVLRERIESMPDMIHIPFEDATSDVDLYGWEDQWFSRGIYHSARYANFTEPKIDFVFTWVNGSDPRFQDTKNHYMLNQTWDDIENVNKSNGVNRYRDWGELKYAVRSIDRYTKPFFNRIQILVNSVRDYNSNIDDDDYGSNDFETHKQTPTWAKLDRLEIGQPQMEILSHEEYFQDQVKSCLPIFNSLTIETQIHNTKSDTDRFIALSDDMLLGKEHAASDFYSPLFGPTMGFKLYGYNQVIPPTIIDAVRFGEKPYLIYTSWLLNRRFGNRRRSGPAHFGHSLSRNVTREALSSFPGPMFSTSVQRFRREEGFQLYTWYTAFHYTVERHREALLWSYVMQKSDRDGDGYLTWSERSTILHDISKGIAVESENSTRDKIYEEMPALLKQNGLEPPKVNQKILWTSLDGPMMIRDLDCSEFDADQCLAPGFASSVPDQNYANPLFSAATIFDRVSRQEPRCGDCLLKLLLNQVKRGVEPLLPTVKEHERREVVIKALKKYQYTIIEPDARFVMIENAEQAQNTLVNDILGGQKSYGQVCLNDDVLTDDPQVIANVQNIVTKFLHSMQPEASRFER